MVRFETVLVGKLLIRGCDESVPFQRVAFEPHTPCKAGPTGGCGLRGRGPGITSCCADLIEEHRSELGFHRTPQLDDRLELNALPGKGRRNRAAREREEAEELP